MTNSKIYLLKKDSLLEILEKHPKIKYYAKRWTQWQLLRDYVFTYTKLYYTAARRGAIMNPPLLPRRPHLDPMDFDDIDVAVLGIFFDILIIL